MNIKISHQRHLKEPSDRKESKLLHYANQNDFNMIFLRLKRKHANVITLASPPLPLDTLLKSSLKMLS